MKQTTSETYLRSLKVGGCESQLYKLTSQTVTTQGTVRRHAYVVKRPSGSYVSDPDGRTFFKTREAALKLADKKAMV